MSGKGNEVYEKLMRELGEKYGDLYQRLDLGTPGVRFAPSAPASFDVNEPLPDLHIRRSRSWEPAARHYQDLTEAEKAEEAKP